MRKVKLPKSTLLIALASCIALNTYSLLHTQDNQERYALEQARTYEKENKLREALQTYNTILTTNPNHLMALFYMGNLFVRQEQYDSALDCYKKIIAHYPTFAAALYNHAYVSLQKLGHPHESIPFYEKAISFSPDHEDAHFGLAQAYLKIEDFQKGLPEWELGRKSSTAISKRLKDITELNSGTTILILEEWGYGDTFQFIRYAQLLKQRGARIIAQMRYMTAPVISLCDYIDEIIITDQHTPVQCDKKVPLLSLPYLFDTTIETIPQKPYLRADPTLVSYWKEKLANKSEFKVGICWRGSGTKKDIPVSLMAKLASIKGIQLYSLQKNGSDDLAALHNSSIIDFGPDIDTTHGRFMDTAAIIKNLDLVITIDTSIAHLAGGLGVSVWTLLPHVADWRWFIDEMIPLGTQRCDYFVSQYQAIGTML